MKKQQSLWHSLESLPTLAAVLADWERALGGEFALARGFLQATTEQSMDYPCTRRSSCGCVHRVIPPGKRIGMVAVCDCGCEAIPLEPKDIVVFSLDVAKLGESARRALKFHSPASGASNGHCRRVGAAGDAQLPVYFFAPADEAALVKEVGNLVAAQVGPLVLLTPTATHHSTVVAAMQARHGCLVLALSRWLDVTAAGVLKLREPLDGVLAAFYRRLAEGTALSKTVERFDRNLAAVANQNQALRAAKGRLEEMHGEGLFAFASKIDHTTLEQFFAILASGDIAKASRQLDLSDSTLRSKIAGWKRRGKPYAALAEFVRWRKSIKGQAGKEFAKRLASGAERDTDYPALIRDAIGELESFNSDNWAEKCDNLDELLRSGLS